MRRHELLGRFAGKRQPPGQHLEEHHAEAVEIAAPVELAAAQLLGAHVFGRAEEHAGAGQGHAAHLGDAEVEHLDELVVAPARHQHHVRGLEIAMHHAAGVRLGERFADLRGDVDRARRRQTARLLDGVPEVAPVEMLHREIEHAVGQGAVVVDGDDVRMIERGRGARFEVEARRHLRITRQRRVQQLDHGAATHGRLVGEIDRAHSTLADLLDENVLIDEPPAEIGVRRRGGLFAHVNYESYRVGWRSGREHPQSHRLAVEPRRDRRSELGHREVLPLGVDRVPAVLLYHSATVAFCSIFSTMLRQPTPVL